MFKKTECWFISAWFDAVTNKNQTQRKIYIKPCWNACFPETHDENKNKYLNEDPP